MNICPPKQEGEGEDSKDCGIKSDKGFCSMNERKGDVSLKFVFLQANFVLLLMLTDVDRFQENKQRRIMEEKAELRRRQKEAGQKRNSSKYRHSTSKVLKCTGLNSKPKPKVSLCVALFQIVKLFTPQNYFHQVIKNK